MSCEDCVNKGLPERLCFHNKPNPLAFVEGELLYRRHKLRGTVDNIKDLPLSTIGSELFKLRSDSYNRSHLSETKDVLINNDGTSYPESGIISLPISPLTEISYEYLSNDVKKVCTFRIMHTPEECNYSHAEIFIYVNDEKFVGAKPNKNMNDFFRRKLLSFIKVVKETTIS